ncbi:hypothetical protein H2199_007551 [Coniosporium tulheliwenetii]|uniref:Uncharacterized protein n=1 Tax=Coniosporium tulheliwenetii TaxID=3383036 RepID=A0ACC2YPP1_9PEZI|nr:hypothetical protein H2199_007551 [Cladosporium sp. JES 115]
MAFYSSFSFLLSTVLLLPSLLLHTARWHAQVAARDARVVLALVSRIRRAALSKLFGTPKTRTPALYFPPLARDAGVSPPAAQQQPQHEHPQQLEISQAGLRRRAKAAFNVAAMEAASYPLPSSPSPPSRPASPFATTEQQQQQLAANRAEIVALADAPLQAATVSSIPDPPLHPPFNMVLTSPDPSHHRRHHRARRGQLQLLLLPLSSPPAQLEELEALPALPPSAPPSPPREPEVLSCTWCYEPHTTEECLTHFICPQCDATGHQPLTCLVLADSTEMVRRARMVESELVWRLWQQLPRDTRKCRDDEAFTWISNVITRGPTCARCWEKGHDYKACPYIPCDRCMGSGPCDCSRMVGFPNVNGVVQENFSERLHQHQQTFPLLTALADAVAEMPDAEALAARPKKALKKRR